MKREEAIQVLQTALTSPFIYGEYADAIKMAIKAIRHDVIFEQIKWERDVALDTLEEHGIGLGQKVQDEISDDGTLKVKVKDSSKVNRVLVCGDNIFGGLYYPDDCNVHNLHNGDLINREDAIDAICKTWCYTIYSMCSHVDDGYCKGHDEIEAINALPSAGYSNAKIQNSNQETQKLNDDLISREEVLRAIITAEEVEPDFGYMHLYDVIELLPSADAVQGWRIGKPTEQGRYMVTLDSFGYKHIDLFYYGKPLMPNRKVRGKCWYRSDDEWGDVVYDDKYILAWQPLPTPYGEREEE